MIREVRAEDAERIAAIYNEYVAHSTATFDTQPVSAEEMRQRIVSISAAFPYLVYETEEGEIAGYCYAHTWKEKAAYRQTLETTIYLSPLHTGKGIGTMLLQTLIERCRQEGYHALIACITEGNDRSVRLHRKSGFRQVSRFEQVGRKFGRWVGVEDWEKIIN